ncbi:unnamed protein product [Linum trigynum]|uniref:Cystatin domain-containing protein n=1 Tax=Linum trigynum TaxID=586398 RepID=A0AAV2C6Z9_9ROSI
MGQILFLVAIGTVAIILPAANAIAGGWQPIKNVTDEHVKEIAEFAVKAHDSQAPDHPLHLVSVDRGETQIVAGTNYRLVLTAAASAGGMVGGEKDGSSPPAAVHAGDQYLTIVYETLTNEKKLVSFNPLHP